eukprot:scaffold228828_cov34-Prasinocladus_malaysianus.AAC.1
MHGCIYEYGIRRSSYGFRNLISVIFGRARFLRVISSAARGDLFICPRPAWQSAGSLYLMVRYISSGEATGTSPLVQVLVSPYHARMPIAQVTLANRLENALSMALEFFCDPFRPKSQLPGVGS